MSDVAIVIGHHPDAPGAELHLGGRTISEYRLWKPFARELARTVESKLRDSAAFVIERPNQRPDKDLVGKINTTKAACAIELHFNSFADEAAHGTEMLHWHTSTEGKRLAQILQEKTTAALGTESRGLKPISHGDRGASFLRLTEMPAVICEPAFGSNPSNAWRLLTRQCQLMRAYRRAIIDFVGR